MSCIISNTDFIDNISQYNISENFLSNQLVNNFNQSIITLNYNETKNSHPVYSGATWLDGRIAQSASVYGTGFNKWYPIIVEPVQSKFSKKVNRNFTQQPKILGYENFFNFKGEFRDWSSNDMSVDWFINTPTFIFEPFWGILGWIKYHDITADNYAENSGVGATMIATGDFKYTSLSGNSVSVNTGTRFTKYNSDILVNLQPNSDEEKMLSISGNKGLPLRPTSIGNMSLYIDDADFFCYYENPGQQFYREAYDIAPISYISPTGWQDYQHIYDVLTRCWGKKPDEQSHLAISQLSSIYATHPLKDRITHEYFSDFSYRSTIGDFISTNNFENFHKNIFNDLTKLEDQNIISNSSSGFISNNTDLFNRIITKYKPYLWKPASIKYNHTLPDGPHLYVNTQMTNHCDRNIKGQVLYNTAQFNLGQYSFYTDFSIQNSNYIISPTDNTGGRVKIPLFDTGKSFALYDIDKNIGMTAGPDIYIPIAGDFNKCDNGRMGPGGIKWQSYQITEDILNPIIAANHPFYSLQSATYQWELISGVEEGVKIVDPDKVETEIFFSSFGKFTLQLTVVIDELAVYDSIDIYIVNMTGCTVGIDGDGLPAYITEERITNAQGNVIGTRLVDNAVNFINPNEYLPGRLSPVTFNRNRQGELDIYLDYRFSSPIIVPNDRNICKVPNITEFIFSKYGAVMPAKSNSYIEVVTSAIIANDDQQYQTRNYVGRLDNGKYNKFFYTPIPAISNSSDARFSLNFNYAGGVNTKIYRIRLERTRDVGTGRCKGIYENKLYRETRKYPLAEEIRNETRFLRDIPGPVRNVVEYSFDAAKRIGVKKRIVQLAPMPDLSTLGTPKIKPFGGHGGGMIDWHEGVGGDEENMPSNNMGIVIGHDLVTNDVICHLQEARIKTSKDPCYKYGANNPNMKFIKGTFHPGIGFIEGGGSWKNKTSSLKFNTGNKNSFTFTGPGFYTSLRGDTDSASGINIYNDVFDVEFVGKKEEYLDNTELEDFDIHHGYRRLSGDFGRLSRDHLLYDEYIGSYGNYSFALRGRRFSDNLRLQGSNLIFARIRNIEVKLNFLNQVNLKNTAIYLVIKPSRHVSKRVEPRSDDIGKNKPKFGNDPFFELLGSPDSPVISNISKSNQGLKDGKKERSATTFIKHEIISEYLDNLKQYNETSSNSYTLYLLNRENVDSNTVDSVYHFSDRFSKNLTPRNMNNVGNGINKDQKPNVTNYIKLQPSLVVPDYEYPNTDQISTALKNNDMFWPVNSFIKFFNQPIVMGAVEEGDPEGSIPKPDSSFGISLHIETFGEHDMVSLDNISNISDKIDTNPIDNRKTANVIFNSLCSWEVILDIDTREFADKDSLGKIKYGWEPAIPGYNFITDDLNAIAKLPQSIINAPNQHLNDLTDCFYDETTDESISPLQRPREQRFPSEQLVIALGALALGALGGVIGLAIGIGIAMPSFAFITRFLSSIRRQQNEEAQLRALERTVYTERGHGGPDKILLDVATNEPFVYTLEASVYRYGNTPVLARKVRKYIKPNKDLLPELATFRCILVKDLLDIFEPYIFDDTSLVPDPPEGLVINSNITLKEDSLILYNNILYVAKSGNWATLDNTNIPIDILCANNLLSLDLTQYNKMVLIKGYRAYNYFDVDGVVQSESGDSYKIAAKGKIIKNSTEYTVLQFHDGVPNDDDLIFLDDADNTNIIVWTEVEPVHYNSKQTSTKIPNTLFPKGTYGTGSPVIDHNFLSNQYIENDLSTIYDIFNNQECDIKPLNRVEIYKSDTKYEDMVAYKTVDPTMAYNLGVKDYPDILQGLPGPLQYNLTAGYSYNLFKILENNSTLQSSNFIAAKNNSDETNFDLPHLLKNIHNPGSDSYNVVELKNGDYANIDSSGYVVVEGDYDLAYPTSFVYLGLDSIGSINVIMSRLKYLDSNSSGSDFINYSISKLVEKISTISDMDPKCDSAEYTEKKNECEKLRAERALALLYAEKNQLLNLLDTNTIKYDGNYNIIYIPECIANTNVVPVRTYTIHKDSKGDDQPIRINESQSSERYWINIDPEQRCKVSRDASIKILLKAKYTCWPTSLIVAGDLGNIPTLDRDAQNICPSETKSGVGSRLQFDNAGNVFTYEFDLAYIARQKAEYAAKYGIGDNDWEELVFPGSSPTGAGGGGEVTRSFFIRPGTNTRDILVEVEETYLVPSEDYFRKTLGLGPKPEIPDGLYRPDEPSFYDPDEIPEEFQSPYQKLYGEYYGKVKDLIPSRILDNKCLACKSRVIPRKLRRVDLHYDRYKPDFNGNLVKDLPSGGPGGPFSNVFQLWHCANKDTKEYRPIPDYFKIQNEMIYRAYFGSVDNIEHKSDLEYSMDPFEWIPYEYHAPNMVPKQ